ncbi:hypothetical protein DICPUDRAFT_152220 [Dictyostelium purpureum]|uniref:B box-type domain-containing protein n=1 Tax=Dictyostelium purpureum TaxID=5786 RepID=F0ZKS3_DICPU|nr:uncharacterized protein DICPUDRAFT_152220 [Dictyostelium purpureum]EGC35477.1 hypothetical protein DICPUDRAFT_152220 [Dictyostelium purpureum]|eukprot:XP_003288020.1 hypothetical protein DICPUDRAFT_152220 [Dictyostelium purpureum]
MINNLNEYIHYLGDDKNCFYHRNSLILLVCDNCLTPICIECMTSNHKGHSFSKISKHGCKEIYNEILEQFQTLNDYKSSDQFILDQLDECKIILENNHRDQIKLVTNRFKELHDLLSIKEMKIVKELESLFSENQTIYIQTKTELETNIKFLLKLLEKYHYNSLNKIKFDNLFNIQEGEDEIDEECDTETKSEINNEFISIFKDYYLFKTYSSNKKYSQFQPFEEHSVVFNQDVIEGFKDSLNFIIKYEKKLFKDKETLKHLMIDKQFKLNDIIFKYDKELKNNKNLIIKKLILNENINLNKEVEIINNIKELYLNNKEIKIEKDSLPDGIEKLHLGKLKEPLVVGSIPRTVRWLWLEDGFNQPITSGIIPDSVHSLYIGDVEKESFNGESVFPNSIRWLYFLDGFGLQVINDIIPKSVESIHFYNIKSELSKDSIPSNLKNLCFRDGFDKPIPKLPNSIEKLHIFNIKREVSLESLPQLVKFLFFYNGFSQVISNEIIPSSVHTLYLGDINYPIKSIPATIKHLYLDPGPDQPMLPGIIAESVFSLYLYKIKHPLIAGSIPKSVKYLRLCNGFNQPLLPGVIPSSVEKLSLYDIRKPLLFSSIPNSVKELFLCNKFSQELTPGLIPNSVQSLHLYDIAGLLVDSIPNSVDWLFLEDGFNIKLFPRIIPSSVKRLSLYNIKQQLMVGSIPEGVEVLYLCNGFNQNWSSPNILPSTLKEIYYFDGFNVDLLPTVLSKSLKIIKI